MFAWEGEAALHVSENRYVGVINSSATSGGSAHAELSLKQGGISIMHEPESEDGQRSARASGLLSRFLVFFFLFFLPDRPTEPAVCVDSNIEPLGEQLSERRSQELFLDCWTDEAWAGQRSGWWMWILPSPTPRR